MDIVIDGYIVSGFREIIKTRNTMPSQSESMTCLFQYYPEDDSLYLCPYDGENVDVYRLLSNEGGLCVFDRKCNNDVHNYQGCGCSFMSVGDSVKLSETLGGNYMEVSTRICEDNFGNIVSVWSSMICDDMVSMCSLIEPIF